MSETLRYSSQRFFRITALVIGVFLVFALLLATVFVLLEQHHDCSGDTCAICAAVTQTVAFLKAEASVVLSAPAALSLLFALFVLFGGLHPADLPKQSPVSLKVKLSD